MNPDASASRALDRRRSTTTVVAIAGLIAVTVWRLGPLLQCPGSCFVDFDTLRGANAPLLHLQHADTRLNTWILAWVQHAILAGPRTLFDANVLHPTPNALVGSEHLIGLAIPLLPLRVAGAGPVAIHQSAIVLSYLGTGITTFLLVRWLCGSVWAAFLAGATATLLPWRISELSHVQLLSTQWIPLVWLGLASVLIDGASRLRSIGLAVAVSLQLLSSYYLAYFTAASCTVIVVACVLARATRPRNLAAAAAACIVAAVPLAIVSIPYLRAGLGSERTLSGPIVASYGAGAVWRHLSAPLEIVTSAGPSWRSGYQIPWIALVLAAASLSVLLPVLFPMTRKTAGADRRVAMIPALWGVAFLAFVFALGDRGTLAGETVSLPGAWAAAWIPGFGHLRAPLRWGILVCTAVPVLAGLGAWAAELAVARAPIGLHGSVRWGLRGVMAGLLLLGLPPLRVPAAGAYDGMTGRLAAYEELGRLPRGPVLEVPWPPSADWEATLASQYMLGSTAHWQPLLNGYTAYMPQTYAYLRRLAQRLPDPAAVGNLVALSGLRWIVLHLDVADEETRSRWRDSAAQGGLVGVYSDASTVIYEAVERAGANRWLPDLISTTPRERTFAGLARAPLVLAPNAGSVTAAVRQTFVVTGSESLTSEARVTVTNAGNQPWPGLDIDPRGLVALRYSFVRAAGEIELEGVAALDADVPPGRTLTIPVWLRGRVSPGAYRLRVELVQHRDAGVEPLPIPRFETDVTVERIGAG